MARHIPVSVTPAGTAPPGAARAPAAANALPTTANQALARMMTPSGPTLARLTKEQERKLATWKANLKRAAEQLTTKPDSLFTPKFKRDHVKLGKTDTPPSDFQKASTATATRRWEPRAKEQREKKEDAEKRAGQSSLVFFGPTALANMKADMQAWAAGGNIHTVLKEAAAEDDGTANIGPGGKRCDVVTGHQYTVSSVAVHTRFDRVGGEEQKALHIGPNVQDEGRTLKVHHFGGTA